MNKDSVNAIDLTRPLDAEILVRDHRPTIVMKKNTTVDGLQKISNLQIFPHSHTHIDLPNRLDMYGYKTEYNLDVYSPHTYPCTIISLHEYANLMRMYPRIMGMESE